MKAHNITLKPSGLRLRGSRRPKAFAAPARLGDHYARFSELEPFHFRQHRRRHAARIVDRLRHGGALQSAQIKANEETEIGRVTKDKKKEAGPQNILIPIDFSAASKNAFRYALDLGREGSHFFLLHVVPPRTEKGRRVPSLIAAARKSLASFAKKDHAEDVRSVQSLVRIGTPFEEILAAARDRDADLIVLGVHDSDLFGGLALGRTADRVSRYAKCPVLLVREPEASASATVGLPLLRD